MSYRGGPQHLLLVGRLGRGGNGSAPGACRGAAPHLDSVCRPFVIICLMVAWKLGLSSSHSHFLLFNYFEAFDAPVRSACEL